MKVFITLLYDANSLVGIQFDKLLSEKYKRSIEVHKKNTY